MWHSGTVLENWTLNLINSVSKLVGCCFEVCVTSGGYGHTVGKSLAMALVTPECSSVDTELSVHIVGQERGCRVIAPSPADPAGKAMRPAAMQPAATHA